MEKIGFIGTGVMGKAICGHLLKAGYELFVYNRTKEKTADLVAQGAIWCDTPTEVARQAEIIFTMVGFPADVEAVYFGETGIFQAPLAGKILVDLTTSTPTLATKIAEKAALQEASALDAPVSGGDIGAKNGTLTIMLGGDAAAYQAVQPILAHFSKQTSLHGGAGKGQHTKMANQIMIAGTMTGLTEMLVYAAKAGLDLEQTMTTLGGGAAANFSMTSYGPRILAEDYSPGFFVKHFIKDLGIALAEAQKMSLQLPGTELAYNLYHQLAEKGYENDGTQALIKLWWPAGQVPKSAEN